MARNESDSAWKDLLDIYLKDFLDYCLPHISEQIDWSRPWAALDKELKAIVKGKEGKRLADKLFSVYLKDGTEQWVLIHIEIQNIPEHSFPERMFIYHYRIYDKHRKPILSCAILTDNQMYWRPTCYQIGFGGSYIKSKFLTVKIMDYLDKMDTLAVSNNPFAQVILIQLEELKNRSCSQEQRKNIKFALTKRLYAKKFSKESIMNLYAFLDWLIGLPESLELEYLEYVHQLEEEASMAYVTSAERLGMKRGLERGMKQGMEQGMEQGIKQGIKQGIEQGIEQGIAQGTEQGLMRVARRLLAEGMELDFIAKMTGLSLAQIAALRETVY